LPVSAFLIAKRPFWHKRFLEPFFTFLKEGFDIGSSPTEAFCKTLTSRLKGSGMRWDKPNAEAMMALAALEHSHLWDAYWTSRRREAA